MLFLTYDLHVKPTDVFNCNNLLIIMKIARKSLIFSKINFALMFHEIKSLKVFGLGLGIVKNIVWSEVNVEMFYLRSKKYWGSILNELN